jgi:hypothetical protein
MGAIGAITNNSGNSKVNLIIYLESWSEVMVRGEALVRVEALLRVEALVTVEALVRG